MAFLLKGNAADLELSLSVPVSLTGKGSCINNDTTLYIGPFGWMWGLLFSELGAVRVLPFRLGAGLEFSQKGYLVFLLALRRDEFRNQ